MDSTAFAINDNQVSHKDFADEVVVIHFETGTYYSLRGSAAILWQRLARGPASLAILLADFVDPPENATAEIGAFLAQLKQYGLVIEGADHQSAAGLPVESQHKFAKPELEAFDDLQALLLADVIHDTDEQGWPNIAPGKAA